MVEQFSPGDGTDRIDVILSDYEKAFGDSIIQQATRDSRYRAKHLDMSGSTLDIEERIEKHVVDLDMQVVHAYGTTAKVTGLVITYTENEPPREIQTSDAFVEFRGFVSQFDDTTNTVRFDYAFRVKYSAERGQFLSSENFQEVTEEGAMDEFVEIGIHAKPEDVFVEYDAIHPIRANAWLGLSYPQVLQELDERIIDHATSEEDSLLALRGFSLDLSDVEDAEEISRVCLSIKEYVNGMITVDTEVPYLIDVDGECIVPSRSGGDWGELVGESLCYTADELSLYSKIDQAGELLHVYEFAFSGRLHGVATVPSKQLFLPLDSIQSIIPLRPTVAEDDEVDLYE